MRISAGWPMIAAGCILATAGVDTAVGQRTDPARVMDSIVGTLEKPGASGCALGVGRGDRFVYRRDFGLGDIPKKIPLGPGSTFYMASVSKQFGAAAIALASIQGKLGLDDDVRKWVPELPDYGQTITVRHLVHHTSGIRDYLGLQTLAATLGDVTPDSAVIALLARQKALNFKPGTEYSYSNSGYFLLSVILQRATGVSLREYAEREFFGPLGMKDTYFYDDHRVAHRSGARRAIGYFPNKTGGYDSGVLPNFEQVGDGGLFSTVDDSFKWARNLTTGKVGGPRFLELMTTTGRLASGAAQEYAFGLMVRDYAGVPTVGHSGVFQGYRTMIQRYPTADLTIIILCNLGTMSPEEMLPVISDAWLADEIAAAQRPLTGEYWSDELGTGWRVIQENGRLAIDRGKDKLPLRSLGNDRYDMATMLGRANLVFVREGGRVVGLETGLGPRTVGVKFVRR